jgi:hypothetical protein
LGTVVEVIEAGEMPPEDKTPLSEEDQKTIVNWYRGTLASEHRGEGDRFQTASFFRTGVS